jgi:hypothetical protein
LICKGKRCSGGSRTEGPGKGKQERTIEKVDLYLKHYLIIKEILKFTIDAF